MSVQGIVLVREGKGDGEKRERVAESKELAKSFPSSSTAIEEGR